VIDGFDNSLADGGWLFVGHSEAQPDLFRAFECVHANGVLVYRKPAIGEALHVLHGTHSPAVQLAQTVKIEDVSLVQPPTSASCEPVIDCDFRLTRSISSQGEQRMSGASDGCRDAECSVVDEVIADIAHGHIERAAARCGRELEADELNPRLHLILAQICEHAGHYTQSEHLLKRVLYLDRKCILAHYYLGAVCQRSRRIRDAMKCFENVMLITESMDGSTPVPLAREISVADLREMSRMKLKMIGAS
jgi:chemotaxis protein methyltransferase CheR